MTGEKEALVDMEYFEDMIDSVVCHQGETGVVNIRFSEQFDFDSAAEVWQWVTNDPDNEFLLIVGAGDCGWNTERMLYRVTDLDFKDTTNTAQLHTTTVT